MLWTMATSFWTAKRKKFWMLGGVLIVLTAGVVLTVFLVARQPDNLPRQAAKGEISAFVSDGHKAAFREGVKLDEKFPAKEGDAFARGMWQWVGIQRSMDELFPNPGVTVLGLGSSAVPGLGSSAQARLKVGEHNASVFFQQYRAYPDLTDGAAYTLASRGLGSPIVVWRRGGMVCYLAADSAEGMKALREGMGAPEPKKDY